eukprot:6066283-Pyramimonas_sp.AAC.1
MATFLAWATNTIKRGRARAPRADPSDGDVMKPMPTWRLSYREQYIPRVLRAGRSDDHAMKTMFTWKSDRPPLRVQFSTQANMATGLL